MATTSLRRPAPASATKAALAAARADEQITTTTRAGAKPAPGGVTLPPSAFAADWKGRPSEPQRIGLRLVSESVSDQGRAEATASADRHYPNGVGRDEWVEHWNGVLMRAILAQAVCKLDDVETSWFKAMAADMIGIAFTEKAIVRLWQAYVDLQEQMSPLLRVAGEVDVLELARRLAEPDAVASIPAGDLRVLGRVLDDMRERAG